MLDNNWFSYDDFYLSCVGEEEIKEVMKKIY